MSSFKERKLLMIIVGFLILLNMVESRVQISKNKTESFPMFLAKTIDNATLQAQFPGFKTTDFEFLYLHGQSNHVQFDCDEVELELGMFVKDHKYPYPIQSQSNFFSQPNTVESQSLLQSAVNYSPSGQIRAENEYTPDNSEMQNTFQGENLPPLLHNELPMYKGYNYATPNSWQTANQDYYEPALQNSYGTVNNSAQSTKETSQPAPFLQGYQRTRQENGNITTQQNTTDNNSQPYQQQQTQNEIVGSQQASYEYSPNPIFYQQPQTYEKFYEQTVNQEDTTNQNNKNDVYQQYNWQKQRNYFNQNSAENEDQRQQNQERTNGSILGEQGHQKDSVKKITMEEDDKRSNQSSWTEELNPEKVKVSPELQQESFSNLNERKQHSNDSNGQFENNLLYANEQTKQVFPQENSNSDEQRSLDRLQKDRNIMQFLSKDLPQLRNEYELSSVQQDKTETENNMTQGASDSSQTTYRRYIRESKDENNKLLSNKRNIKQNKEAKRVLGKQLLKTIKRQHKSKLAEKGSQRMTTKRQNGYHFKLSELFNKPSETNFLIQPSNENNKSSKRSPDHDLLMRLEVMRYGYEERHNKCPDFVIFGTSSKSCYTLTTDKNNCAEEFIEVKGIFKQSCTQTQFYIYTHEHEKRNFQKESVQSFTNNGINVLI